MREIIRHWTPAVTMMLVSMISYIDRNTLALLAPTILKETHLSGEQYGFVISAFSVAYMLANPLWGRILDRVGVRVGMSIAVGAWTLASASHVFARGFWGFAAARAMLGFGEGATFPGGLRAVMQTLDPARRSRGIAVAYSGGSLGAIVTPIIITPVAERWQWRGAFWFTGLVGAAWLAWWAVMSRRADLARAPQEIEAPRPLPVDCRLGAYIGAYALGAFPAAFVLYAASLYLHQVLHKSQGEIGAVLWIPPLGWELGYFFWGWVTDRFAAHGESLPAMRRLFGALMLASLPLALIPRIPTFGGAMAALFFAMFIAAGFIIGAVAYATSIYSMRHSGLIAGIGAGTWSAVVAVAMPLVGRLFDQRNYQGAFAVATLLPVMGWAVWRTLHRA